MTRTCAIKDCQCKKMCHPLYSFPIGSYVRCLKWLKATGKRQLLDLPFVQLASKSICRCHFGKYAPAVRGKLSPDAYPILYLPQQLTNQELQTYCIMQQKLPAFKMLMNEYNNNENIRQENLTNESTTQLSETNINEATVSTPKSSVDADPTMSLLTEIIHQNLQEFCVIQPQLSVFQNIDKQNNNNEINNEENCKTIEQCEEETDESSNDEMDIEDKFNKRIIMINATLAQRKIIEKLRKRPSVATIRLTKKSLWNKLKLPNDKIYYHPIMQLVLTQLLINLKKIKIISQSGHEKKITLSGIDDVTT